LKYRKRTTKALNSLILYTAFLFGVSLTIISPVLIEISSTISASVESMGVLFSIFFLGFIIGAFLNSLLSKYMLRKKIFLFSTFFLSASFIAVVFAPTLLYLLISFFIMGICGGLIETTVSLVIIDVNEKRKGFYINILHAFIGLGALMGPYLQVLLINMGFSWRSSFLVLSVLCLISFLFYFFFKIPEPIISEKSSIFGSFKKVRFDLKFFMILILFFVMFFYVNVELGINTWIPTYLRIEKGFTFLSASNTLSNF